MKQINKCTTTDIFMADGFSDLGKYISTLGKKILWIFDSNTYRMAKPLPQNNILLEASENAKSFKSIEKIISKACEENMSRDDIFIAMGGGVVLDTASFAASIYKRGCSLILIPTTLLSMTDASIGGKTGINYDNCKNCIGTFYPANSVILCTDFLQSLSESAFLNGLGEIIKTAFLSKDEELLREIVVNKKSILKREDPELRKIIELSVKIKSDFVNQDPTDKIGIRHALNLGHTFGHALESLRRMNVSHGQAVAWGVAKSAQAARALGLCTEDFESSIIRLYKEYGFDVNYKINFGEWYEYRKYLYKDKKIQDNQLKFIILKQQGEFTETVIDDRLLKKLVVEGPEVRDVLL